MEVLASMMLAEYHDRLDERAMRWLSLLQQNGQALSEHVKDILELVRVGSVQEAIEAVDPALVIHGVLNARAAELQEHNVRVQMAMTVSKVPCHRAYLRQVFDNLISNAIKFSAAQPEPLIQIIAKRHGDMMHFSVSDNGCGIPPKDRERVFQPFVRLDSSIEGSGIGLAIVKRIVEFYQGKIWVEDSSEQGCTVTFSLHLLAAEALRQDALTSSETASDIKNKASRTS
jgi:signal transduction histidine kinase